jgi:hypothetical protein
LDELGRKQMEHEDLILLANRNEVFHKCLMFSAGQKELIEQFDRLTGYNLSLKGSPIVIQIDKATGFQEQGMKEFIQFVYNFVYLPLKNDLEK